MLNAASGNRLKEMLVDGRRTVEAFHRQGASGEQVAFAITSMCDRVILGAYQAIAERLTSADRQRVTSDLAVVAIGGYGRGDLAPYSDIDLLFLTRPRAAAAVRAFISDLIRELWDIGLEVAQSVRTPAECVAFARQELSARTALAEMRLLTGGFDLYSELQKKTRHLFPSQSLKRFLLEALAERGKEHEDYYAATVCLLEPNIKKSPGGLRDIHLLRWVALAGYGTNDPRVLEQSGRLSEHDAESIAAASEFLHRVRNELHFHAGSAQDVLTLNEQVRLTQWLGFEDQDGVLGVERFMQHYYRQTTALHDAVMRFVERARPFSRLRRVRNHLLSRRVEQYYHWTPEHLSLDAQYAEVVLGSGEHLLHLFELARGFGVPVAHETLEQVRAAAGRCSITAQTRAAFLRLLANPMGLGTVVRGLHRAGLLGRLLPPFEHVRCLIQFNQYHKYTVDEHSLRALEAATRYADDRGPLGRAYREIHHQDVLHLALLLHDLGKGRGEDHIEVGRRLAEDAAEQFALNEHRRDLLVFLVHKHLLMAHTAFRRDVSDVQTLVQFARQVGTPEVLRMLYVMTAADTDAVAPGSWTAWKESLLTELYARAMEELTGEAPFADEAARAAAIRQTLQEQLAPEFPSDWARTQLEAMPLSYLLTTEPQRVAAHLCVLQRFNLGEVHVDVEYVRELGICAYTVFTNDGLTPGIFSKIAGVLAATGIQIVSAQIVTRSDGIVVDTFRGIDLDYAGEPPPERRQDLAGKIQQVLLGSRTVESLFTRHPAFGAAARSSGPTQVEIDNDSSNRFTIIEVFADDRQGLLYVITRTLFELDLSVSSAKISTRLDQVVDAFYVTGRSGQKLTDDGQLSVIRQRLLAAIEAFGNG